MAGPPWRRLGFARAHGHATWREPTFVNETVQRPVNPYVNPSYPQRVHIHERPKWQALLKTWDERVTAAGQTLPMRTQGPDGEARRLLYIQMMGARDQLAEAVRRLPMEVGSMYEDDRLRLEEAVAALERLFQKWETSSR
jgi:hypothetical protein